jgi:hypothetical protein
MLVDPVVQEMHCTLTLAVKAICSVGVLLQLANHGSCADTGAVRLASDGESP